MCLTYGVENETVANTPTSRSIPGIHRPSFEVLGKSQSVLAWETQRKI